MDMVAMEYKRDDKLKKEDVNMLQVWLKSQPHLPEMTEQEIIWFLKSCYYSNEAAKSTIDKFFTMKTLCPEILRNKDLKQKGLQETINTILYIVLPTEGYALGIARLMDVNAEKFNFHEACRLSDMVMMLDMFKTGTKDGIRCCIDMQGATFGHVARVGIISLKKFVFYFQDALPIRLKSLHFFNSTPVLDTVLTMIKPFLKKEIAEMLYVHKTVKDMQNFVPLECFPSDYGGKATSLAELHEKMKKDVMENGEFFAHLDSQLVDEKKRPGKPKNEMDIFGTDGTFKKLDID
ncbi:hypothetical protein HHI36_020152 [Cryptolaemus montrouzieri]|uniref:CRAL-TRIO domain-containing protein n=1 Tax=Cryptolaemus montrouzieri TaxID=559131 RepID=A0ABD2N9M4_9CUCU